MKNDVFREPVLNPSRCRLKNYFILILFTVRPYIQARRPTSVLNYGACAPVLTFPAIYYKRSVGGGGVYFNIFKTVF